MTLHFYKYQGTGNDFVIFDNRDKSIQLTKEQVAFLCDRRFGIGADGLMLLNPHDAFDFQMIYYNADGGESTMCGNGGRCLVKFAAERGIQKSNYQFIAIDGPHEASIGEDGNVSLKMNDVSSIQSENNRHLLNTGSPHYVQVTKDIMRLDVFGKGRAIRYSDEFRDQGVNVNFLERQSADTIFVRTYERGVEDETFSCGTGVTAAALVSYQNEEGSNFLHVQTKGGKLAVRFEKSGQRFFDIHLIGPATKVFEGTIELPEIINHG